jgi:hypothetical protein
MTSTVTILGIAGSLRTDSYNRAVLCAAQHLAPADATIEIFDLQGIPPFNQDDEQHPPATVTALKTRIRAADAIYQRAAVGKLFRSKTDYHGGRAHGNHSDPQDEW